MRIGFPINTDGPGGVRSWVKTFGNYCTARGHKVYYSPLEPLDLYINLAYLTPLEKLVELKNKGTKIIHRMDGVYFKYYFNSGRSEHITFNEQIKNSLLFADKVIYQSYYSRYLTDLLCPGKNIPGEIIYNGADTKLFRPQGNILPRPKNKKIVLSIAYWGHPAQADLSIRVILATARQLVDYPEIEFWILGLAYPQTEQLIRVANLPNVTRYDLHTPIPHNKMPEYIRTADLIFHTRPNDACSNLIIEAMNVGKPVVAFNSGSSPELLGDAGLMGTCRPSFEISPEPNLIDMANKILRTFDNYDYYTKRIRARAKLFTQDNMCKQYFRLIDSLLKPRKA